MDDSQGPRSSGIIRPMVAIIKIIVDDDDRAVVPAERTPADIIVAPIPVNPSRTPMTVGNPIPPQPQTPMPAAVMIDTPAPGLGRNPGPAAERIPDPAAIIIGPPIGVIDSRNPDIAVWPFVNPGAVGSEFILIVLELGGQIALGHVLAVERIALAIPVVKIITAIR